MTLGFPTLLIKILACIPINRYKKIGTICFKDTFFRIPLAATRSPQSQCLGSSLAARSLHDDRQARNNNIIRINQNSIANRRISII
jgi:hypothetical protein